MLPKSAAVNLLQNLGDKPVEAAAPSVSGLLFFWTLDATHGYELWQSDGTEAGTFLVRDIYPGAALSGPVSLTRMNGTLFFAVDDGTHGQELWALTVGP